MGPKITKTADSPSLRSRHLRWESFAERIHEGPPSLEPIKGSPRVALFIDPGGARIGIRFHTNSSDAPVSSLAEVAIRCVGQGNKEVVEISTSNESLYRDFYALCCTIADRVQQDKVPIPKAIADTLHLWSALLRRKSLLSTEGQVGLLGELLFLQRVAEHVGWAKAANAWQGPRSQEHDFTLKKIDLEVKTTLSEKRLHQISSLTQLMPKLNRPLVLISVQLTPGSGSNSLSLSKVIAKVLTAASIAGAHVADLIREQLTSLGWADIDAAYYTSRYHQRSRFAAIPVNEACPAIVPQTLSQLGPHLSARIERLSYAIDVDGLGVLDHSKQFDNLIFQK